MITLHFLHNRKLILSFFCFLFLLNLFFVVLDDRSDVASTFKVVHEGNMRFFFLLFQKFEEFDILGKVFLGSPRVNAELHLISNHANAHYAYFPSVLHNFLSLFEHVFLFFFRRSKRSTCRSFLDIFNSGRDDLCEEFFENFQVFFLGAAELLQTLIRV